MYASGCVYHIVRMYRYVFTSCSRNCNWLVQKKKKKKLKFAFPDSERKKTEINHWTFFSVGMRLRDRSKYPLGQNFALSLKFGSDWDQVPGIPVKSGPEIFAIFVFTLSFDFLEAWAALIWRRSVAYFKESFEIVASPFRVAQDAIWVSRRSRK